MTTKAELLKLIRANCVSCMGGYEIEVAKCTAPNCDLFGYRMGKDPWPNQKKSEMARERATKFGFKASTQGEIIDENQRQA